MSDTNERMTEAEIYSIQEILQQAAVSAERDTITRNSGQHQQYADIYNAFTQLRTDLAESKRSHDMAECMVEAAREHIQKIEADLAAERERAEKAEQQRDAAVEGLWKPASEHPDEFEDGDAYLVRIPVIDHRHNREYMDYYIICASCDSETPLTWNDQHGNHWCEWDWEDVEAYIKLATLATLECAEALVRVVKGEQQ